MTAPAVSVSMLLYNRPHFMRQAIESVLAQTFGNFEFVILDHASKMPEPLAIAKEYAAKDSRIIVHRADKNIGVSAGRNMLLAKARGEFVATIEDDDWWAPDKLEKQVGFLRAHQEVGAVYCSSYRVDTTGKEIGCYLLDGKTHPINNSPEQINLDNFNGSGQLFRRAALNAIGGWRPWFVSADDVDLIYRLQEQFPIHFQNLPLLYYRWHDDNLTKANKLVSIYHCAANFSAYCRRKGKADIIDDNPSPEKVMERAAANSLSFFWARKVAKSLLCMKRYSTLKRFLAAYKTDNGQKRGKLFAKLLYWSLVYNRLGFWFQQ